MTQKVKKSVMHNISSKNAFVLSEKLEDNDYLDDKMCISETTITEAIDYARVNQMKEHEISIADYIKIESSSEACNNTITNKVNREDEIFCADDIKIEFDNGLPFCNNCQEVYQNYCTKCEMLVHILNPSTPGNRYGESEGIPKDILEIKELFGRLGIFTSTVIPKDVKFGPFTGLSTSGSCWRLKDGRLVGNGDKSKSKFLNWMQYINPARNLSEQNLLAFRCENMLYYRSISKIQVNDELLVYFGEEYNGSLNKDFEVDFIPTVEEDWQDVFACTFCCLGFSSKTYLSEHKTICPNKINGKFSIEELTKCAYCKIYLDKKEYLKHHMSYCRETSDRPRVPLTSDDATIDVRRGSAQARRHIYKCTQCNYQTAYKEDLQSHTITHCEVKIYKSGICNRRFKIKEVRKYSPNEYSKAHAKAEDSKINRDSQGEGDHFECSECDFRTKYKHSLTTHIKAIHLKESIYKCEMCDYKTNKKLQFEIHMKTNHLKEFNYKCDMCTYKTNGKRNLKIHIKTTHLKEFNYTCEMCDFKTNRKFNLKSHIKTKHLKEFNYKCEICNYKTNTKLQLEIHTKTKHLKEFNYKCEICDYKTNWKSHLESHIKTKHLKEFDFKCELCEYKTNEKTFFEYHIKANHLKEFNYECGKCHFKTNFSDDLDMHVMTKHLKEFDYECKFCKYKTYFKNYFERHIMKNEHF